MPDPTISTGDSGYAPVNGLEMYHEVNGAGSGRPLVLLHGNLSTIGVDFGGIIPSLAKSRQVIGVEQQAHGHTADIDRPLSIQSWTSDTVALLRHLGIGQADLFGFSSGSAVGIASRQREGPAQLVQYRWIAQMAACPSCSHGQQRAQVPGVTVPQSGQARSPRSARQAGQEQGWRGSGARACKWRPPGRGAGHPCQLVLSLPPVSGGAGRHSRVPW
jgi:hypothetical protein